MAGSSRTRSRRTSSPKAMSDAWARSSPGPPAGSRSADEITTFDSTGLAIQDLAIALAALESIHDFADLAHVEI